MAYLIKGGRIICPKTKTNFVGDMLIEDGKIKNISKEIKNDTAQFINAHGKIVIPGIVDIHTHMRTPGFEYKEDLISGSSSALAGGITTAVCMPNTKPSLDNPKVIKELRKNIDKEALIKIEIISAITKGIKGDDLAPLKENQLAGAVGFSDDGRTTMNDDYMVEAFKIANECQVPIITHCEDHEKSDFYKDKPAPPELEYDIIKRDIELCEAVDGRLHICHISTKEGVEYVRAAKEKGLKVTCEVAPHHFSISQEEIDILDPYTKVNPPIRSKEHKEEIIKGIVDGTIDIIATDHAPHEEESKKGKSFAEASFGITGFETSFALSYTNLVQKGHISIDDLVAMMTYKAAELLKLDRGTLEINKAADVVIADLSKTYTVDPDTFLSKGHNTPFRGKEVTGQVTHTFVNGILKFEEGKVCQ